MCTPRATSSLRKSAQKAAIATIKEELDEVLPTLGLVEAHRLRQRTNFDLEMIQETGSCKGIENYSRHFDGRKAGEKPYRLLDYFPDDFLLIIDESHQTIPQLHGMYNGDRSRKETLVRYGFRLPSALDNRPLKFHEFEQYMRQVVFVSATPGPYELRHSTQVVEQIIRPTGLVDPGVEVRPTEGQAPDVISEVKKTIERGDRVLVTTLTKKLAEELSEYLADRGIRTRYLHSEIQTLERTEIIRELRLGKFDVLVGINLLREGLDIPEVGFIGILDADKEGFLRDARSLIQIIGRAARNVNAKVCTLCGFHDRFDEGRDLRDKAPAGDADRVQYQPPYRPADHHKAGKRERSRDQGYKTRPQGRDPQRRHRARKEDAGRSRQPRLRTGHRTPRTGKKTDRAAEAGRKTPRSRLNGSSPGQEKIAGQSDLLHRRRNTVTRYVGASSGAGGLPDIRILGDAPGDTGHCPGSQSVIRVIPKHTG